MPEFLRRAEANQSDPAQPMSEKRESARYALLIRTAKLITPQGEFLCVVRDASETGISVRAFHHLPECDAMTLEMPNGDQHAMELVWQGEDRAGFRFCRTADIARIIEAPSEFSRRPLRVRLFVDGIVSAQLSETPCQILDLSQQGAKIACERDFAIDQRVKLKARGMREVNAKVRWRRKREFGLVFEDTFQFGDLARIVAALQLGALDVAANC